VWRRRPDRAEAEARRVGSLEIQKAESYLPLLSFIAQAAPLLGLLGTVLGMVDLFLGLQSSGLREVDVSLLSSGIWKALLTTAAGLTVAVPTLAAYSYLAHRADGLRLQVTDLVQQLLTEVATRERGGGE
jgi:biopolymer transport protein ExbB